jgi:hypothetical protein
VLSFSEGVCGVAVNKEFPDTSYLEWYFIDKTGRPINNKKFQDVQNFHNGFAVVQYNDKSAWINKKGNFVFGQNYDECKSFSEGFATYFKDESCGLINKNGKTIIRADFSYIGPMKEGFAPFSLGKNNCGFLDTNGAMVIKPVYQAVSSFNKGYAYIAKNNKVSILNKSGKILCEDSFDSATGFWGLDLGFIELMLNSTLEVDMDTIGIDLSALESTSISAP